MSYFAEPLPQTAGNYMRTFWDVSIIMKQGLGLLWKITPSDTSSLRGVHGIWSWYLTFSCHLTVSEMTLNDLTIYNETILQDEYHMQEDPYLEPLNEPLWCADYWTSGLVIDYTCQANALGYKNFYILHTWRINRRSKNDRYVLKIRLDGSLFQTHF